MTTPTRYDFAMGGAGDAADLVRLMRRALRGTAFSNSAGARKAVPTGMSRGRVHHGRTPPLRNLSIVRLLLESQPDFLSRLKEDQRKTVHV
jgi:hypothetical protein